MKRHEIAVSGGFDPIHVGHVRMIQDAAKFNNDVVVILNTDEWLMRKKGYVFMPFEERAEILLSIKGVVKVVKADDDDGTVSKTLEKLNPYFFGNGGDRTDKTTPEKEVCERLGITPIFGLGQGGKIQSSSDLVKRAKEVEKL